MAGIKRKSSAPSHPEVKTKSKKSKTDNAPLKHSTEYDASRKKTSKKAKIEEESEALIESDTTEDEHGFYGFSANADEALDSSEDEGTDQASAPSKTSTRGLKIQKPQEQNQKQKKSENAIKADTQSNSKVKSTVLDTLNGMLTWSDFFGQVPNSCNSDILQRSACQTESPCEGTQGRETECRCY
jgi:pumilio homology domain family member 6